VKEKTMPKLFTSTLVEADTIGDAIRLYTKDPVSNLEDLRHWHGRLGDLLNELDYLSGIVALTQQERNTLLLLVEFHDGSFTDDEDAPFDVRAANSARAKLKG
jgi:hypothetical protein